MIKTNKNIALALVLLVGFIDWMGIGLVYPMFSSMLFQSDCRLLPADTSDAGRGACLGILLAMMPITQFFSSPILGMLSDQKGRKKVLIPSLLVGVLGYLIAVLAVTKDNLFLLILSRIAIGISAGTAAVVGASVADLSTQEEKTKNFGLFNMACGLGFTVGPFLGGVLSHTNIGSFPGYAVPFVVAGIVTLANLLLIALYFKETYQVKEAVAINWMHGVHNIQKAFKTEGLRGLFLSIFLACAGWSFYWEFIPVTWINEYAFDAATIGNFYAYGAAMYAFGCGVLIRPIANWFSSHSILFYSLLSAGAMIGIFLLHMDANWLWIYIPLQQFAIALFWPTAAALVSNSAGKDAQGEMLGVLHSIDALAFAVSPLIAGPLLGISSKMPVIIGGAAMWMAAIALGISCRHYIFGTEKHKPSEL
ncbi:MAG: MFS transporter [Parachlamydiaceae bacterium]|nr:MFS transporter [Parachlamydiaceae bacterium]